MKVARRVGASFELSLGSVMDAKEAGGCAIIETLSSQLERAVAPAKCAL